MGFLWCTIAAKMLLPLLNSNCALVTIVTAQPEAAVMNSSMLVSGYIQCEGFPPRHCCQKDVKGNNWGSSFPCLQIMLTICMMSSRSWTKESFFPLMCDYHSTLVHVQNNCSDPTKWIFGGLLRSKGRFFGLCHRSEDTSNSGLLTLAWSRNCRRNQNAWQGLCKW